MDDLLKKRLDLLDAIATANSNAIAAIIDTLHDTPGVSSQALQARLEHVQKLQVDLEDQATYDGVMDAFVIRSASE